MKDNWKHGTLKLSGIGHIAAHGKARQGGDIRASDVLHRNGQWFLSLTVQVKEPLRERTGNGALAFDWGVDTFVSGLTHDDEVIAIDNPRWCSHCWNVQKKQLSQRTHECATCGHTEPRDIASARVVLRWVCNQILSTRRLCVGSPVHTLNTATMR